MNAVAGPSKLVSRSAPRIARAAVAICPTCLHQRRHASDDRSWWQRVPGLTRASEALTQAQKDVSQPYFYDGEYARRARQQRDAAEPSTRPLFRGSDDAHDDQAVGIVHDKGVEIRPERLWREVKVRQYGEQLPTEHRFVTPLMNYSPLTLGYIARLVRRLPVEEGLLQLKFLQKRFAGLIRDQIFAGYLDAIRRGLDREKLVVDEIQVHQARTVKRADNKAYGRQGIIRSRTCRYVITLKEAISPLEEQRRSLEKEFRRRQRVGSAMPMNRDKSFGGPKYLQGRRHRW